MGFILDSMRNALPLTSALLLPIGFSIDKETGLHLSLGYVLSALIGMTKIPYISATLQIYLSLNSITVLQSLFVGTYKLQEPWVHLIDYYIYFMLVFKYVIIVLEPFLVAVFIRYINERVIRFNTIKQFMTLSSCAIFYIYGMRQLLTSPSFILTLAIIAIHILLLLMFTKQTEPITGPILLLLYICHLFAAPSYIKSDVSDSYFNLIFSHSSNILKLVSWSSFIQVIFSYHIWDMLLKSMLMLVIGYKIKGFDVISRPLLLIMYTNTLMTYFYADDDFKEISSILILVWHVAILLKPNWE